MLPLLLLAPLAAAQSVAIQDASFDNRSLSAGAWSNTITPWQETGGTGNGNGFVEHISGFSADGQNHLGMNFNHNVWQDPGVTYQANTRYTLTVAVGHRGGRTSTANQSQYLLADSNGTIYATGIFNASTIPAGTFADAPPLEFETGASSPAIGRTIRILLQARGSGRSHFDRVRLTAVPMASVAVTNVTNVTAAQTPGTKQMVITYDVAASTPTVAVSLSVKNGDTPIPVTSLTGQIGPGVATGTDRGIIWDAGADWDGNVATLAYTVTAEIKEPPPPEGMALVPGGWFTMGSTSGDTDSNAQPVNVHVSEFYMATHEVTWELWNDVRNWALNQGYTDIATGDGKGAAHPVHWVNWWDVVKWCNARSEREGLTAVYRNANGTVFKTGTTAPTADWSANGYRLPTEAEWEKAARGGVAGQRFPWGDTITHSHANYWSDSSSNYDISPTRGYHPSYNDGTAPFTSPVGSFAPNGYGLYDMAGNVWEWCWDWDAHSSYTNGASDPKGAAFGSGRVLRGGGWRDGAFGCRSAIRGGSFPGVRRGSLGGFRPARSSVP